MSKCFFLKSQSVATISVGANNPKFLNQNQNIFSLLVHPGSYFIKVSGFETYEINLKRGRAIATVRMLKTNQHTRSLFLFCLKKRLTGIK